MERSLSRDQIVRAALERLESDGLAGLSMRRIAGDLGFEAMSLYRHVANKADLLDAVYDAVLAEVPIPIEGTWQGRLRQLATGFRTVLMRRPAMVPLIAGRPASTPSSLALLQAGVDILVAEGWSEQHAIDAFQTVFSFAVGHCVFHTGGGTHASEDWSSREFQAGLDILIAGLEAREVTACSAPR